MAATVSGNPDGYTGDVIYRFYIGEDTTTDFSVKRNTAYAITLTASGDGLGKKGWLIDTSGLGIDPLFNFNPPELPEYVGQWARIRFPNADGLRTVTVSSGNEEIIVGTASEGIDSLCLENGAILLYAPEVSFRQDSVQDQSGFTYQSAKCGKERKSADSMRSLAGNAHC